MAVKPADYAVAVDTRNRAPVFADQDTETDGVQNTETTRKVDENAEATPPTTTWAARSRPTTPTPTKMH